MTTPLEIMQSATKEGRTALFDHEAKEVARSVGIVVPKYELVEPGDEASLAAAAEKIGFPVVIKAVSPQVLHKTEAGAVLLDVKNKAQLVVAAKQITKNVADRAAGAVIRHFLIEKMMPSGPELLVGALRDEQFGPAIAVGLGGIWAEVLKDTVFGILPLTETEMIEMIDSTRAGFLFKGFREIAAYDRGSVVSVMTAVSRLMTKYPQISEIDLNPVRVYARGAAALDVRIILQKNENSTSPNV